MKATLRVLSIGSEDSMRTIYCALFGRREYELITATTYRELCAVPAHESFQIAVLNDTLSQEEIVDAAQLIRRRWSSARILVISTEVPSINDALYDDRIVAGVAPELLFATMDRIVGGQLKAAN